MLPPCLRWRTDVVSKNCRGNIQHWRGPYELELFVPYEKGKRYVYIGNNVPDPYNLKDWETMALSIENSILKLNNWKPNPQYWKEIEPVYGSELYIELYG